MKNSNTMPTLFNIKHKIMLKNGNYTALCIKNTITMVFEKEEVAVQTFKMMKADNLEVIMTAGNTVIQTLNDLSEEEIVQACREALEARAKTKSWMSKFSYTEEKL
jgi:hypothetical protein